jgi:hypothetical protein
MTLSFTIHRSVAIALPIDQVAPRSLAAGLVFGRLEYSTVNARGQVRVTCGQAMGIFLVEQLRVLAADAEERHDSQLLVDAALAVEAVFAAIDESKEPGASNGTEPTPY